MEPSSAAELDIPAIRRRIEELRSLGANLRISPEEECLKSKSLLNDCILNVQKVEEEVDSELAKAHTLDLAESKFLDEAKEELRVTRLESTELGHKISELTGSFEEELDEFEKKVEHLSTSFSSGGEEGLDAKHLMVDVSNIIPQSFKQEAAYKQDALQYEFLRLEEEVEDSKNEYQMAVDLEAGMKRFHSMDVLEGLLSDTKVVEYEENRMRISLKTFVPKAGGLLCQSPISNIREAAVIDHELLIGVAPGTMDISSVEIVPDDIAIDDLVEDAKNIRHINSASSMNMWTCFEWLVRKVHHRAYMISLRHLVLKDANKSRPLFKYSNQDDTITANLIGGVEAIFKVPKSWPSYSSLKLVYLKNQDSNLKGISLELSKIEATANSLDEEIRADLLRFAEAIEETIREQIHSERN